jgi:hypothetical protein
MSTRRWVCFHQKQDLVPSGTWLKSQSQTRLLQIRRGLIYSLIAINRGSESITSSLSLDQLCDMSRHRFLGAVNRIALQEHRPNEKSQHQI